MDKDTFTNFLLFLAAFVFKCEGKIYELPRGYQWKTCNGELFVRAGSPPRHLRASKYVGSWQEHAWIVFNKKRPEGVELIPLSTSVKNQIIREINVRRAKTLLGAYFDPERTSAFGTTPPAAHLSTVQEYNEDIAEAAERSVQHFRLEHHVPDEFFPHYPLGENLMESSRSKQMAAGGSLGDVVSESDIVEYVTETFQGWFENELRCYRHIEPFDRVILQAQLDKYFRDDIRNDKNLSEEQREWDLRFKFQYGHATALIAENMYAVGCALSSKIEKHSTFEYKGRQRSVYNMEYLFGCKFGGAEPLKGKPLYKIDEGLLQMHDLSKSVYDHPTD